MRQRINSNSLFALNDSLTKIIISSISQKSFVRPDDRRILGLFLLTTGVLIQIAWIYQIATDINDYPNWPVFYVSYGFALAIFFIGGYLLYVHYKAIREKFLKTVQA
jgi:hypothetical protein